MNNRNDLVLRAISVDWSEIGEDSYLRSVPAIASLSSLTFQKPITFFAGENGSGKSTLLEAIAMAYG
ncbi:MAG: AAA family ATPase, partial [Solobacterium sp.]|nr:AAA family ATPase [Solobacterium sp.]